MTTGPATHPEIAAPFRDSQGRYNNAISMFQMMGAHLSIDDRGHQISYQPRLSIENPHGISSTNGGQWGGDAGQALARAAEDVITRGSERGPDGKRALIEVATFGKDGDGAPLRVPGADRTFVIENGKPVQYIPRERVLPKPPKNG